MVTTIQRICFSLCLALAFSSHGRAQISQPKRPPSIQEIARRKLSSDQVSIDIDKLSFEKACAAISEKCGINLNADDVPKKAELSLKYKGSISGFLDKLADYFDYYWSVNRLGYIELMRRYFEADDYPQRSYSEMLQISKEMQSLFAAVNLYTGPNANSASRMYAFAASLSSDQKSVLRNGKPLLPSQLTPNQYALYRNASLSYLVGDILNSWNKFQFVLSNFSHGYIRMTTIDKTALMLYYASFDNTSMEDIEVLKVYNSKRTPPSIPVITYHEGPPN